MSKIIFESGLELQSDFIETSQIYSHGANRNCLQISSNFFLKSLIDGDFTNLKDFAKTNLINGTVTINDNDNDFVYTNYEIFHELKYNGSEYVLTIAQLTEQEIKYNELLKRIEALEK